MDIQMWLGSVHYWWNSKHCCQFGRLGQIWGIVDCLLFILWVPCGISISYLWCRSFSQICLFVISLKFEVDQASCRLLTELVFCLVVWNREWVQMSNLCVLNGVVFTARFLWAADWMSWSLKYNTISKCYRLGMTNCQAIKALMKLSRNVDLCQQTVGLVPRFCSKIIWKIMGLVLL